MRATVLHGDCLAVLATLPPESVACCVTSPPYWGLRDYGTATWEGGDDGCDHARETKHQAQGATSARVGRSNADAQRNENFRDACGKCGARRVDSQIGLEPTPEAYVEKLVAVFREVRRVLRGDGTVWLNLGDSYATQPGKGSNVPQTKWASNSYPVSAAHRSIAFDGLKPKDLVGIPWRVAFALQADGWYLRSDIIWAKPNPMPESVTDRPTKAHEYVFLFSNSARYWYDAGAIAEEMRSGPSDVRKMTEQRERIGGLTKEATDPRMKASALTNIGQKRSVGNPENGRNARTVWTIATQPYAGAHFATFPPELARRCVRAGCPPLGTVLDPFSGSGTTGAVAIEEGRAFIGIELNPGYCTLAEKRLRGAQPPLFATGAA